MTFAGIHHLALCTNDMKSQLDFYTKVVGMKLVALFPMHGAEGASHCFIEAGPDCYFSFIQMAGPPVDPIYGMSHAQHAFDKVAGGAMQHLAFNLKSMQELMDMRDRLRTHGYAVLGPLDHGSSFSIYSGAPEGVLLEFSTSEGGGVMDGTERWVDAETCRKLDILPEDVASYVAPPAFAGSQGAVPQPDPATAVYPTPIPRPMFAAVGHLDDAALREAVKFN